MSDLSEVIDSYRTGTAVKRFHTVSLIVDETVGHHSANVALLCAILAEGKPSAELLLSALTHDLAEQHTGDVPAPAKWASQKLQDALNEMEDGFAFLGLRPTLTPTERRILKQADMLDLILKCRDEMRMGNFHHMQVVLTRGVKYLLDNDPLPKTLEILEHIRNEG